MHREMIGERSPEQRREICLERFVASIDIRSSAAAPPSIGKIGPVVDEQCFPSIALICETIERHLTQGRLVVGVSGTGHDDGVEDVAEAVRRRDAVDEQVRIHRHEWLRSVTLPRNAPGEGMERAVMVSSAATWRRATRFAHTESWRPGHPRSCRLRRGGRLRVAGVQQRSCKRTGGAGRPHGVDGARVRAQPGPVPSWIDMRGVTRVSCRPRHLR